MNGPKMGMTDMGWTAIALQWLLVLCVLEADEGLAEVEVLVGRQVDDLDGHEGAIHVDLVHLRKATAAHLPDQSGLDVLPLDLRLAASC